MDRRATATSQNMLNIALLCCTLRGRTASNWFAIKDKSAEAETVTHYNARTVNCSIFGERFHCAVTPVTIHGHVNQSLCSEAQVLAFLNGIHSERD